MRFATIAAAALTGLLAIQPVVLPQNALAHNHGGDLEKTMKFMGRNFKALNRAGSLSAMLEPAENLQRYIEQAKSDGLSYGSAQDQQDYERGINYLHEQSMMLNAKLAEGDFSGAKRLVQEMNETRKQGHERFNVD